MTIQRIAKCIYAGAALGILAGILYLTLLIAANTVPYQKTETQRAQNCYDGLSYDTTEEGSPRVTYMEALDTCKEK